MNQVASSIETFTKGYTPVLFGFDFSQTNHPYKLYFKIELKNSISLYVSENFQF